MISKSVQKLFNLIVAFSLILSFSLAGAQAQQNTPKDDETLIKDARAELQTVLAAPPPSGSASEGSFKISVAAACQKLRDLLLQKKGLLRGSIRTLQTAPNAA